MACHQAQTTGNEKKQNVCHAGLKFLSPKVYGVCQLTLDKREKTKKLNSVDAPNVMNDNRIKTRKGRAIAQDTVFHKEEY